jgi:hypothetical protein
MGAAGAGAQTCPELHPLGTGAKTDSQARAAWPQATLGTTAVDWGVQLPPWPCGDAPIPWTFAHTPWTSTHAPAVTTTLSHAVVHP